MHRNSAAALLLLLLAARGARAQADGANLYLAWCKANATVSAWPICDPTQALDARSADIVSRLSLADKIAALYGGQWGKYGPGMGGPAFPSVGIEFGYNWWSEAAHGIWFVHFNEAIPYASNAVLPITSSCSFNRSLWSSTGNQIGREGRAFTNIQEGDSTCTCPTSTKPRPPPRTTRLTLAPNSPPTLPLTPSPSISTVVWAPVINIVRDPRWGQVPHEYSALRRNPLALYLPFDIIATRRTPPCTGATLRRRARIHS